MLWSVHSGPETALAVILVTVVRSWERLEGNLSVIRGGFLVEVAFAVALKGRDKCGRATSCRTGLSSTAALVSASPSLSVMRL